MRPLFPVFCALLAATLGPWNPPLLGATWKEIKSQEQPAYNNSLATMTVGRDGLVYLCCSGSGHSFLLRMTREGKVKFFGDAGHAASNATADAKGTIATANVHAEHSVTLWDNAANLLGKVTEFLVNDQVGYDAPCHVEAGASGDFYGLDRYRDRILRINANGDVVKIYSFKNEPADKAGVIEDFRVCEKNEAFYLRPSSGPLRCIGFDGKTRWTYDGKISSGWPRNQGSFDVDDNGALYVIELRGTALKRVSPKGEPLDNLDLEMGDDHWPGPSDPGFTDLRVYDMELLIRRIHDTEVFQRYNLATGVLKQVVTTAKDD